MHQGEAIESYRDLFLDNFLTIPYQALGCGCTKYEFLTQESSCPLNSIYWNPNTTSPTHHDQKYVMSAGEGCDKSLQSTTGKVLPGFRA